MLFVPGSSPSAGKKGRPGGGGPHLEPITREEMREADRRAIEEFGIPGIVLMENAALAVVREVADAASFAVVCAPGNNGGDGLAVARHLLIRGRRVEVFLVGDPERGSADFRTNLGILRRLSPDAPLPLDESSLEHLGHSLRNCEVCVDALFGTGLTRPIEGLHRRVVETIGVSAAHVVAVDLPSGIDADTGRVLGAAVRANRTVTFHRMKRGLELAPEYAGTVTVAPIGIPGPEIPCVALPAGP